MKAICFLSVHPVLVPFSASFHVIVATTLADAARSPKGNANPSLHLCELMSINDDVCWFFTSRHPEEELSWT